MPVRLAGAHIRHRSVPGHWKSESAPYYPASLRLAKTSLEMAVASMLKCSMRWLDFLGGAAWGLVLDRNPSPVVECLCRCECEALSCPASSWWWELLKIGISIFLGCIIQGCRLIQRLGQWKKSHAVSEPSPERVRAEVTLAKSSTDTIPVEVLAQQQLQALRKKQSSKQ